MQFISKTKYEDKAAVIGHCNTSTITYTDNIGGLTKLTMFEADEAMYIKRTMHLNTDLENSAYYIDGEIGVMQTINALISDINDKTCECNMPWNIASKYITSENFKNDEIMSRVKFVWWE